MQTIIREAFVERRQPVLAWTPIIAGAILGIGVWILLQMFVMGIGLVSIDVDSTGAPRGVSWLGLWTILATLVAMFFGGAVAARYSNTYDRNVAMLHSVIAWAVAAVIGTFVRVHLISSMAVAAAHNNNLDDVDRLTRAEMTDLVGRVLLTGGVALVVGLIGSVLGALVIGVRHMGPGSPTRLRDDTIETPATP